MASKKKIEEYTTDELRSKLKALSSMSIVLLCIYAVLFVTMLVYCWTRNWEVKMGVPLIVVCVAGMTTLLPLLTTRNALSKELNTRGGAQQ